MANKKENGDKFKKDKAELDAQLKAGSYAPVYLIMGEQDYLRTRNRDRVQSAILGTGDPMNAAYYTGDHFTIPEIIDLADTLPFLSEHRVITIENSWLFGRSGADTDALTGYLQRMPETSHLVLVEKEPNKTTRLYKEIKKRGFVLDCRTPDERDLRIWTAQQFRKDGLAVRENTLELFLSMVGDDMLRIEGEKEKLIAYCMGRSEVTAEDVRTVCSVHIEDRIFDLIGAVMNNQLPLALSTYMDLRQRQTAPQVILSLMIRNYNQLLQVQEFLSKGLANEEIAGRMRLNPWVLKTRIRPALSGKSAVSLIAALQTCLQMDMDYKSGRISDELAVEELIVNCAGAGTASH